MGESLIRINPPVTTTSIGAVPLGDLSSANIFSPENYGAASTFSSSVSDTAAVQAAVTAAQTAKGQVLLRRRYNVSSGTITISAPVSVRGFGGIYGGTTSSQPNILTGLLTDSATSDCLQISATSGVNLENFAVANTSGTTPTGGVGLSYAAQASGYYNTFNYSTFDRVQVMGFYDNIKIDSGRYYTLRGIHSYDPVRYGLVLTASVANVDTGDAVIDGCFFDMIYTTRTPTAAIFWSGGGGPKITNNKVNGNAATGKFGTGMEFSIPDGASTSDFFINSNSIENITSRGIYFHQTGTTGTLSNIHITGNEIGVGSYPTAIEVFANSQGQMNNVTVTGNTLLSFSDIGINFNSIKYATIGGNVLGASGSPSRAIRLASGHTITIAPNTIQTGGWSSAMIDISGNSSAAISVSKQNTAQMNTLLISDFRSWGGTAALGSIDYEDQRRLPSITSTSTWVPLYNVYMPSSGGGAFSLDVKLTGIVAGTSAPFAISASRLVTQPTAGGACTVTSVGTDAATDTTNLEYQFDTATTSGAVIVSARLKSGGTATGLTGVCTIKASGTIQYLNRRA